MDADIRDEWGAVVLGFAGFFLAVGFMVMGMLPAWIFLGILLVTAGMLTLLALLTRRLLPRH